jgi:hypothetical protein
VGGRPAIGKLHMIRRTIARPNPARPARSHARQPRSGRRILAVLLGATAVLSGAAVAGTFVLPAQAAANTHAPRGRTEAVHAVPGGISLKGWAFDQDAPRSTLTVYLWIDGKLSGIRADQSRPDVAAAYPGSGSAHGFAATIHRAEGSHRVCVVAHNTGPGADTNLGCTIRTVVDSPRGRVEAVATVPGGVAVKGWTFDPDAPKTPLTVALRIDGRLSNVRADRPRPDIAAAFPGAGSAHGFDATLRLGEGRHRSCAVARNIGYGHDTALACATITLVDSPIGRLDVVAQAPGGLAVRGWTFDPDAPQTQLTVQLTIDGRSSTLQAGLPRPDIAAGHPAAGPNHGFAATTLLNAGRHRICATAHNVSYGADKPLGCTSLTLRYTPSTVLHVARTATGVRVSGWSSDPDTTAAIQVRISADGQLRTQLTANGGGATHSGHNFAAALTLKSGRHSICAVGVNVAYGSGAPPAACLLIALRLSPFGRFEALGRAPGSHNLLVRGWAIDPDTSSPIRVSIKVGGAAPVPATAGSSRPDVAAVYPAYGTRHGYLVVVKASDGEQTVCISAVNISAGANKALGCRIVNAVHPHVPAAPRGVKAIAGYNGAVVKWTRPTSDGGAPVSTYIVTASPGGATATVSSAHLGANVTGLSSHTRYTFKVVARNVVGKSPAGTSPAITTPAGPPPQTTPAPISTSRYIRNIRGSSSTDLYKMRTEGAADARRNPAGHGYVVLLDIGGQDRSRGGVLLSATTRFVSYTDLVRDLNAYVDGYVSRQKAGAPSTIAIGTNNDMDVSYSSGVTWGRTVVDAVRRHAAPHHSLTIAGADDIEPGFRGTYAQSRAWLSGYLAATRAPFVFNGSADGCAWTVTGRRCNNGWTMAGLYQLSAGVSPVRIINLPQVYNNTMAKQWKYISLTGIGQKHPKINFGGALTEFTACAQAGGCGSLTGRKAWIQMWNQLQSHPALRTRSLPYSTDLRIDR